ncbi:MAG: ComF family protein [Candidatus Paceibacteria bacterium]
MIHIWHTCLDFWFPPSESMLLLRAFRDVDLRLYYAPIRSNNGTTLSHYSEPFIKASITAGKFEHHEIALKRLGGLLRQHLTETVTHWLPTDTIFVPIPLHPKRQAKRGYNQVTVLLKAGLADTDFRIYQLLERIKNTSPQSHLSRDNRLTHLKGAFAYRPQKIDWATVRRVVLVDDVSTTGSTLKAGKATLKANIPKHIEIQLLAFAH